MKNMKKPEILAPAGSVEALRAAIYAGADAIYLGGNRFGARAYAGNFDEEALLWAISYAHLNGVKIYLTVNTLFRSEEIDELYDYLRPFYEAGLDAVIVQDLGVMKYLHEVFPKLPIHASTQMTITSPFSYTLLKEYGVTRIVPARELSMEEIAALKGKGSGWQLDALPDIEQFVPETEVFVQGALCYCYSGQCLMSSMLGGRSGNRGRCAQTCRLPYSVCDEEGRQIPTSGPHILSPKDLCGLPHIPQLVEAGVDSFKIEGRMKKPEYVAVCVRAYRNCLDAWYEGTFSKKLVEHYQQEMAEVFNRGGFTSGYYHRHNGPDMMSVKYPGNIGVCVGTIRQIMKNQIRITLQKEVDKGDILVVEAAQEEITLTSNQNGKTGDTIALNAPKTRQIQIGSAVRRMQLTRLTQELAQYCILEKKCRLAGNLTMRIGEPAVLQLETMVGERTCQVCVAGNPVERAAKNPVTEDTARSKICATGTTRYEFTSFVSQIEDGAFYPLKALKELRKDAILKLEESILEADRRSAVEDKKIQMKVPVPEGVDRKPVVMVSSIEQYETVIKDPDITNVYLDLQYFSDKDIITWIHEQDSVVHGLVLPPVLREKMLTPVCRILDAIQKGKIVISELVVRNLDELALVKWAGYQGRLVSDYSLYVMNPYAAAWLYEQYQPMTVTLPVELNEQELSRLCTQLPDAQWITYGYQQLMVSAQCVTNTTQGCTHRNAWKVLKDRYQKSFYVKAFCKDCYNVIYNGIPTVLFDQQASGQLSEVRQRLHFTVENAEQTEKILTTFCQNSAYEGSLTRGHYKRGVE